MVGKPLKNKSEWRTKTPSTHVCDFGGVKTKRLTVKNIPSLEIVPANRRGGGGCGNIRGHWEATPPPR